MTHHHYQDDHHHEHTHTEHNDYVSSNKEYFDAKAASVANNPKWIELARRWFDSRFKPSSELCLLILRSYRSSQAMLDVYPFNEESTTVLDFACNVGQRFSPSSRCFKFKLRFYRPFIQGISAPCQIDCGRRHQPSVCRCLQWNCF